LAHVLVLNLIFFVPAFCGATAFAVIIYRIVGTGAPDGDGPGEPVRARSPRLPGPGPGGGSAGPDDLAHSA
jgi:hypothetical protein